MKIAFVYDRVNKFGGAERVLTAMHEIWPEAPLFTAVYNREKASWASVFKIKSSFLQHLPFASSRHEFFPPLTPYVFESFDFDAYDVVLSITSAEAKGIITKPKTMHICYCLTPTRYLWSGYQEYQDEPGAGIFNFCVRIIMKMFATPLRQWDFIASARVNTYIAISQMVGRRIHTYYRRKAEIIYPPVDVHTFTPKSQKEKGDFFLIVSRLVPYKRIDYVISAFNTLGWKLKIIGTGIDENRLKKMAKETIEFIGWDLTDKKLCWYYQNCSALIFPGEEDFGLTAVEVQACGNPVIAFSQSGVAESVVEGRTGELYNEQSEVSLISALQKCKKKKYSVFECRKNALRFSKTQFQKKMKKTIKDLWQEWNSKV